MIRPLRLALIVALSLPSLALAEAGEFLPNEAGGDQWHLKSRTEEPAGANVRAVWPTANGTGSEIAAVDEIYTLSLHDALPSAPGVAMLAVIAVSARGTRSPTAS